MIQLKRAYEPPSRSDGYRVLVERLWPRGLRKAAAKEERKVEAEKGSPLKKGAQRFDERSRSSDGRSAASKQR